MPMGLALNSTLAGIAFGLFPIVWIVINHNVCKTQTDPSCTFAPC
jgi:hypothetical protein